MSKSITTAWFVGFAVLFLAFSLWVLLLRAETFSEMSAILLWVSPAIAAAATSNLGPSNKLLLDTSLAIPSAALASFINIFEQVVGKDVDFPGWKGGVVFFMIVLILSAVAAGLCSVMGLIRSR